MSKKKDWKQILRELGEKASKLNQEQRLVEMFEAGEEYGRFEVAFKIGKKHGKLEYLSKFKKLLKDQIYIARLRKSPAKVFISHRQSFKIGYKLALKDCIEFLKQDKSI